MRWDCAFYCSEPIDGSISSPAVMGRCSACSSLVLLALVEWNSAMIWRNFHFPLHQEKKCKKKMLLVRQGGVGGGGLWFFPLSSIRFIKHREWNLVWCHRPVIPVLGRLSQEDCHDLWGQPGLQSLGRLSSKTNKPVGKILGASEHNMTSTVQFLCMKTSWQLPIVFFFSWCIIDLETPTTHPYVLTGRDIVCPGRQVTLVLEHQTAGDRAPSKMDTDRVSPVLKCLPWKVSRT